MRKTAFKQTLLNLRCHVKYLTMSYQVYLEGSKAMRRQKHIINPELKTVHYKYMSKKDTCKHGINNVRRL